MKPNNQGSDKPTTLKMRSGVYKSAGEVYVPDRLKKQRESSGFSFKWPVGLTVKVLCWTVLVIVFLVYLKDIQMLMRYVPARMAGEVPVIQAGVLFSDDLCLDLRDIDQVYGFVQERAFRETWARERSLYALWRDHRNHLTPDRFLEWEDEQAKELKQEIERRLPMLEKGDVIHLRRPDGLLVEGRLLQVISNTIAVVDETVTHHVPYVYLPVEYRLRVDSDFRAEWVERFSRVHILDRLGLCFPREEFSSSNALEQAAREGNRFALFNRGKQQLLKPGAVNLPGAFRDLYLAAIQHHPEAQYELGLLYYNGKGIAPDRETGLTWVTRARMQGYTLAAKSLDIRNKELQRRQAALKTLLQREEKARRKHAAELAKITSQPKYRYIQKYRRETEPFGTEGR